MNKEETILSRLIDQRARDRLSRTLSNRRDHAWEEISNGKYAIEKTIARMNTQEKRLIASAEPTDLPEPKLSQIYAYKYKTKTWEHIGYRCMECDKTFSNKIVVEKHKNTCERINKSQDPDTEYLQYVIKRK